MLRQIRLAMDNKKKKSDKKDDDHDDFMKMIIEIDETYFRWQSRKQAHYRKSSYWGNLWKKYCFLSMLERDKEVRGFVNDEAKREYNH